MKVFEVNITRKITQNCTAYIKAESWEDAEETAWDKYYDGDYDKELEDEYGSDDVNICAVETDEDPEDYD